MWFRSNCFLLQLRNFRKIFCDKYIRCQPSSVVTRIGIPKTALPTEFFVFLFSILQFYFSLSNISAMKRKLTIVLQTVNARKIKQDLAESYNLNLLLLWVLSRLVEHKWFYNHLCKCMFMWRVEKMEKKIANNLMQWMLAQFQKNPMKNWDEMS